MEGIELVIKIPKYMFEDIQDRYGHPNKGDGINLLEDAVANGTPLPKGHGDLIDRDAVNSRYDGIYAELDSLSNKPTYKVLLDKLSMCLDTERPIIEADVEE